MTFVCLPTCLRCLRHFLCASLSGSNASLAVSLRVCASICLPVGSCLCVYVSASVRQLECRDSLRADEIKGFSSLSSFPLVSLCLCYIPVISPSPLRLLQVPRVSASSFCFPSPSFASSSRCIPWVFRGKSSVSSISDQLNVSLDT